MHWAHQKLKRMSIAMGKLHLMLLDRPYQFTTRRLRILQPARTWLKLQLELTYQRQFITFLVDQNPLVLAIDFIFQEVVTTTFEEPHIIAGTGLILLFKSIASATKLQLPLFDLRLPLLFV
jgi:hypothetical protein